MHAAVGLLNAVADYTSRLDDDALARDLHAMALAALLTPGAPSAA